MSTIQDAWCSIKKLLFDILHISAIVYADSDINFYSLQLHLANLIFSLKF